MRELFRKEAVESFSSSSGMSGGVRALTIQSGVCFVLLLLCTAVFSLWLIFGTIYETVSTDGIIWPPQSGGAVYALYSGRVSKTVVTVGDQVSAGGVLAFIPQEGILDKIQEARAAGVSGEELESLYEEYDRCSVIRSHITGIVTDIADENAYMQTGEKIATVIPYDENGNHKTLIAFIPSKNGGLAAVGMEVQVTPDFAAREEYGYIKAYISSVGVYPVSGQTIKEQRGALFLPSLDERGSYLQLEISFIPDAQSPTHLKWSNAESSGVDVAMGTMCTADIVVRKSRPYEWLFRRAL